ncbi:hypothetical protein BTM25_07430 [Actinomadura rubteroloni]|uniref:DUF2568 domain-containing protein n=1 Tax=Actinomadura rubteroloni TaxID=1926885 RepID=A0A2P4UMS1_9ACTN|nr:YrdB family protein [Actinomadura rubteroloni]POM26346.1 hypothetical protein BTM25_07430 [Actinomadura rubteroloni]
MRLPGPMHVANEGLAFVLELVALAALAWWGFAIGGVPGVLLGIAAPLAAAVLWGLFAAPKARVRLPLAGILTVKAVVFVAAGLALHGVGHTVWGAVFVGVAVVNALVAAADRDAHRVSPGRG